MAQSQKRQFRDAEITQKQILDAAEIEFSRHGLKGARISAIAKQAKITTAMIHYYFENKEGLYRAVLQRPMEENQQFVEQLELDHLSPEDAITFIIRVAIANEFRNPYRQMLWFQEASQNQGLYFKQGNWSGIFERVIKVLERGIESGDFRPVDDPMLMLTHILGVCIFYFTVQENWQHLTPDVDRLSPEKVEKHTEAAIAFVLAAIKKP
ncbi:TetR family transcriptional regulator [Leptolyngbya boryana NIES-2135]|jgi:TetR/AcrR family transcriptional regulator|uniref:TetR family transcriptional regulator n=1 Tax=Leptolyngbya boryana NIES-2135 TaxID=1973484 RepID=A0A1Z4JCL9_LEPBY|nr:MULTISPECIES: TetR/AcrR family transcriptional regulator [Leptolyngbya]BAY54502.1 TetR family transcriptional regulator [Leptolyngbya boryana NIES-2135]MBD2365497.1 TetR/AcrR family transcriptional regulator [Leptolyngbya sp. FACHB-161]MBD2371677.1 TetR/AcrR family transcriptional regulator [Leptolyngbya sp. FACHB-238]MBD2396102.1 TetR/AcrR family transcriptional regulator [Leptolyngbya sp. FACHB-239]MBD2402625.1 TetR/AcrR family transcriptional regulator [Leptolyngbya sp. FACHB-402]